MTKRNSKDDAPHQRPVPPAPGLYDWCEHRPWFLALILVVVTFVAYEPTWHAGFIWDDDVLITENRMIAAPDGLYRFWFTTEAADYYPLTSSFWWLQWRLWGKNAGGYHVVNVLLHTVAAILVWLVLRQLKIPGAWLAGLVFAIHPVNVATVAWVSEQKSTLAMLFYAASILLYLQFDEKGGGRWLCLSLVAFLLALLCKSAVVMLPFVLLGCLWWRHGRVRWKDFLNSVPFFLLALILALTTIWFQNNRAMEGGAVSTAGFIPRLVAAGWVPWFYLSKALWPLNLILIYPKWQIDASRWVSWLPGIALVGCFAVFWWKRESWGRTPLFGFGYFVVTLFPVLGFFDQGFYLFSSVADHWQYISIAGVIALVVAAGEKLYRQTRDSLRYGELAVAAAVLVLMGVATWHRGRVYADGATLWQDTLAKNPQAWIAHWHLGNILLENGKVDDAIRHYRQALLIRPNYADGHGNLGIALVRKGEIKEAIAHYEQALQMKPDDAEVHNNLGVALMREGRLPEAIAQFERALTISHDFAEAQCNLGDALGQTGKSKEAIEYYEQALRNKPDFPEAHTSLGNVLFQEGNVSDAIGHYEQALRSRADYAEAHYGLGLALARLGKFPEAEGQWQQALQSNPDYTEAHWALGMASEQAGSLREAIGHYKEALRIEPDFTPARTALARLQAGQ